MTATVAGIHLGLDTHANRPAANTVPDGSFYSCSTHSLVYKSNFAGNSWATWATLGTAGGLADQGTFTYLDGAEAAAPATPAAGKARFYVKADGLFYSKDDAGVETLMSGGSGGGAPTDAEYFVAAAHGSLSAEKVVRGPSSNGVIPVVLYKTADESVANTTLQDDDHLLFAIAANEIWVIQYHLFVTNAANTGDLKMDVTGPTAADVIRYGNLGLALGTTSTEASARAQARADAGALASGIAASGTVAENYVLMAAYVDNGVNAGNVTLRWAQQTTDGTNATVVKAGSFLVAHRVA